MKILWVTIDFRKFVGPYRHYYLALEEGLEKIADITFYGRKEGEDAPFPIKEVNPDIVVFYAGYNVANYWDGVEKIKVLKAIRCTDPWSNAPRHISIIKKRKIDVVLLQYPTVKCLFQKELPECVILPLPQTVNPEIFKPLNLERTYDIFHTGNCGYYYPMREAVLRAYRNDEKCWVRRGWKSIPSLDKYVKMMNQSKILATGNCCLPVFNQGGFRMIQVKPIEALATRTLCAMDIPTCHREMGLEPYYNFVPLELDSFKETLKYYLEHSSEREKIAQRGYETFMKYHSSDVRAKQLLAELEQLVDEW